VDVGIVTRYCLDCGFVLIFAFIESLQLVTAGKYSAMVNKSLQYKVYPSVFGSHCLVTVPNNGDYSALVFAPMSDGYYIATHN
jgi:hypothetical protein